MPLSVRRGEQAVAGLLLAVITSLCPGCGHSSGAASEHAGPKQARGLLPGAIAFWDDRHGLALFGPAATTPAPWTDALESTSDGGRTWRRLRPVPNGSQLVVAGRSRAWLLTRRGLPRSDDRGATWKRISRYPLFDVSFATARDGIGYGVVGAHEFLAATDDGGTAWHRRRFPCRDDGDVDGDDRVSLAAPDQFSVMCVGEPGAGSQWKSLYRSGDGGRSWVRRTATGVGYLAGFSLRGPRRGWLWEHRGWFLRTDDGGRTWSALPIGRPEEVEAASASFFATERGLALLHDVRHGPALRLMRTDDGGRSWRQVRSWRVRTWPAV
jgi:photosystem II stability/assembly factor-like uncharacterized protein